MKTAILDTRPGLVPGPSRTPDRRTLGVRKQRAAGDLVRLLALDTLPAHRRTLSCRWRRDADGRLAALWEPDIVLAWT